MNVDSIFIRPETRTLFDIVKMIERRQFKLTQGFQKDFIWNKEKQSKLIESCLMRIPLPAFYLAEEGDGSATVIDGLQRLATFLRYLVNEFDL